MRRVLLVLLAATPWLVGGVAPPPATGARLAVQAGSARLATAAGVIELAPGREPPTVDGAAHLQVDPRAEIELGWPRRASLRVTGPAALEWHGGDPATVRLLHARAAHAESRGAPLTLHLAGGWTVEPEGSLLHVEAVPGGGWRVGHDAGRPATLVHPAGADGTRPRTRLLAGCRLLLTGAGELRALRPGRHVSLPPRPAPAPRSIPSVGTVEIAPPPPWLGAAAPWVDAGKTPSFSPALPREVYTPQTFLDPTPVHLRMTPWGVRRAAERDDR